MSVLIRPANTREVYATTCHGGIKYPGFCFQIKSCETDRNLLQVLSSEVKQSIRNLKLAEHLM